MRFSRVCFLSALLTALALLSASGRAVAQEQFPDWSEAFDAYVADPEAGADRIIELGKQGTDGLPSSAFTVLGDAYLRQGNYGAARRSFLRALEDPNAATQMGPGKAPISNHAQLGLALAAVGSGKLGDARRWFAEASGAGGDMGYLATLGHAQTAIALGRHDEGLELLAALSESEGVEASLVESARFASANALLDAGDYEEAAAAFEALAADSEGAAATDAAFAAAIARHRGGSVNGVLESLTVIAEKCPPLAEGEERRKVSRGERDLDPTAVLQAWVRNYREQSFADYAAGPGAALTLHGCDLAIETVAVFDELEPAVVAAVEPAPPVAEPAEPAAPAGTSSGTGGASSTATAADAQAKTPVASPSAGGVPTWAIVLVLVVAAAGFLLWRRG